MDMESRLKLIIEVHFVRKITIVFVLGVSRFVFELYVSEVFQHECQREDKQDPIINGYTGTVQFAKCNSYVDPYPIGRVIWS